jgi:hypothetical protein
MIKSFSQYLIEDAAKDVVIAFGNFNPPGLNHEKLIEKTAEIAAGRTYRIYSSASEDTKRNPLNLTEKVKFMRKMFPRHARSIMADDGCKNALQVCSKLYEQGFNRVTLVVSEDRAAELRAMLAAYNGKKQVEGGFYNFKEGVNIVVGIKNDPDASALLRESAATNDLELFSKNLPATLKEKHELFNAVRAGMGLKESKNFRKHIQLESVSPIREAYINEEIFAVGDEVVIKESQEVGKIAFRGSNYLIVSMHDGRKVRKWLNGVELLEKKAPDVVELDSKIVIERNQSIPGKSISKLRSTK